MITPIASHGLVEYIEAKISAQHIDPEIAEDISVRDLPDDVQTRLKAVVREIRKLDGMSAF